MCSFHSSQPRAERKKKTKRKTPSDACQPPCPIHFPPTPSDPNHHHSILRLPSRRLNSQSILTPTTHPSKVSIKLTNNPSPIFQLSQLPSPSFPAFSIKQKTHLLNTLTIGAQTTIPFLCFLCPFTSQSNCTNSCNLHLFSWCWFSGLRSLPEGRIFVFASRSAGWKGEIEGGIFLGRKKGELRRT